MRASIIKWSSKRASSLPTTVKQLLASAPQNDINVSGWIKSIRQQKRVAFAELTDGSTSDSLQVVLDPQDAASFVFRLRGERHLMLQLDYRLVALSPSPVLSKRLLVLVNPLN